MADRRTQVGGSWARTGLPSAVASATYNAANHQLTVGDATLTYDLNGNLTGDGTNTYTWNARNQLASLSGPVAGSFVYDAFGRRQRKIIDGTITDFVYDGPNPVRQAVGSNTIDLLTGLGIDEYLTRTDASESRDLLTDALGSTVGLSDSSGTVQTEYSYEPFGATTVGGGTSANELRYTGREDDGTGVYYYRARYYHPQLQRFISEDPIEFAGGDANLYTYVHNRPTILGDPLGLEPVTISAGVAAAIVCAAGAIAGDAVVLAVNGRKSTFGQLAAGAAIGCAGGVGVLAGYAVAAGSAISSAAAAPAVWPVVPSAVAKLQNVAEKFGTTSGEILNMARASNARFIDLLQKNFGNVNIYLARPDGASGFIRVTLDPTQSRVVSAGMVRAGQVGNAVVNGRLIPAE